MAYYDYPIPTTEAKGEEEIRREERQRIAALLDTLSLGGYLEDLRDRVRRLAHELRKAKSCEPLKLSCIELHIR